MNHIEKLTRLNVELEGLLHVLAKRDTADLRKLLGDKYAEFTNLFNELLAQGEPVAEAAEESLEAVDQVLSHDEVKDQEAVSDEVQPEDETADEAIAAEEMTDEHAAAEFNPEELAMAGEPAEQPEVSEAPVAEPEQEPLAESPAPAPIEEEHDAPQEEADDFSHDDMSLFDSAEIVSVTLEEPEEEPRDEAPAEVAEPAPVEQPEPESVHEPVSEPAVVPPTAPEQPAEENIRVDEMLTRRSAEDLKRAFTLNDKFRFRRELFGQDDDRFRDTLATLNEMTTFDEARNYVMTNFATVDNEETILDFLAIIKPHYS